MRDCQHASHPLTQHHLSLLALCVFTPQKLVQQCGTCHGALLSNHFTAPGKEEFSDTLRTLLKEKYPDVPVVCWGHPKKGGEAGKHYHASVVSSNKRRTAYV